MAAATERLVVLVTPRQKTVVTQRAKAEGLSVGDYIRRQVLDGDGVLDALMHELTTGTARVRAQLDSTLKRIEQSDRERDALEARARREALAALRAELDPERFAALVAGGTAT